MRESVASGASVLFVSHDLDEVLAVTDRITVLRDGRVAGTVVTAETEKDQLVEMIIGRRLEAFAGVHSANTPDATAATCVSTTSRGDRRGRLVHPEKRARCSASPAWRAAVSRRSRTCCSAPQARQEGRLTMGGTRATTWRA